MINEIFDRNEIKHIGELFDQDGEGWYYDVMFTSVVYNISYYVSYRNNVMSREGISITHDKNIKRKKRK